MNCPDCTSAETIFKAKLGKWLCTDCGKTFEESAVLKEGVSARATNPKRIFFSYGHDGNKPLIDRFKADLEKRGHAVWIDYKQLGTWDDWKGGITRGIHDSQLAVAFLSIHSTRDPGVCRNEVAMALHHFGTVYPILVEKVPWDSIPATIQHLQWPDLSDWQQKHSADPAEFERFYEERLLEIINKVEGDATRFASETEVLRRVLSPVACDGKLSQHLDGFIGREWLFHEFENWVNHRPESRVFWLTAGPGFGKTAFAVNLANRFRATVVGTWFCENGSIELTNPVCAVRTLAFQLALRWDDYRTRLLPKLGLYAGSGESQIQEAFQELAKKNLADTFSHLISEPLAGLIWREHKLVILMDALDEATDGDGRNELSALISGRCLELPNWISFVVTSRPDAAVVGHLQRFKPVAIAAEDNRNTDDLELYCARALGSLPEAKTMKEEQRAALCEDLVGKSAGMVLYLRMVFDGLREGSLQWADLDRMEVGLGGLHSRYYSAFQNRFSADFNGTVQPLLRLVLAAPGPLPLELAADLLGWEKEQAKRVRALLGAYLVEDSSGLSLFHKTLGEWLGSSTCGLFYTDGATGRRSLGEFLWRQFLLAQNDGLDSEESSGAWEAWVIAWLPDLLCTTAEWSNIDSLSQFSEYLYKKHKYLQEISMNKQKLALVRKKYGSCSTQYADCLLSLGQTLELTGQYKESLEKLTQALEIYEKTAGAMAPKTGETVNLIALVHLILAEYEQAESLFRRAMEIRLACGGADHPDTAQTMAYLGGVLQVTSRLEEAQTLYENALRITRANSGERHPDSITYLTYLAGIYEEKGDYKESTRLFRDALAMNREVLDPEDALLSLSIGYVGWGLASSGQFAEAEKHYREALDIQEKVLGPEHPYVARTLTYLADVKFSQGDRSAAQPLYDRALNLRNALLGPEHPDTCRTLMSVAWFKQACGETDSAEAMYSQALEVFTNTCGSESADACNARNHLASLILRVRQEIEKAAALIATSLEAQMQLLGEDHPHTLRTLAHASELYLSEGFVSKSTATLEKVFEKRKALLGPQHHETRLTETTLNWVREHAGSFERNPFLAEGFPPPNALRLATR
jgi:tetratricopeptide (TPR) repeat protein